MTRSRTKRIQIEAPRSAEMRRRRRADAILDAEARRLARELRLVGPLPRAALGRLCGTGRWREGGLDAAVKRGVELGTLRVLPFDFLAPVAADEGCRSRSHRLAAQRASERDDAR